MDPDGIVLFGGTFDPIHHAHLIVARAAAETLQARKVILIPAAQPPHKDSHALTPAEHRLEMVRLATAGESLFEVSDCELQRSGPSYSLDTVRHFRRLYGPNVLLYWLIGADSVKELPGWHQIKKLAEECTLVTAARPGVKLDRLDPLAGILSPAQLSRFREYIIETPLLDICATDIRLRVAAGLTISFLTPTLVQNYIARQKLYAP